MFIQIEETPNPNTLKFIPGHKILESGVLSFSKTDDLTRSPLAGVILDFENLTNVFFAEDFISVTKTPEADWSTLKNIVVAVITDYFIAGYPAVLKQYNTEDLLQQKPASQEVGEDPYKEQLVAQIKELIEMRVRPAVAQDGGDIVFHDFIDGIVYLKLYGACSGCPSSVITLKNGIENMLKHYVPEVKAVEQVAD